jgi:hypothetical protein
LHFPCRSREEAAAVQEKPSANAERFVLTTLTHPGEGLGHQPGGPFRVTEIRLLVAVNSCSPRVQEDENHASGPKKC